MITLGYKETRAKQKIETVWLVCYLPPLRAAGKTRKTLAKNYIGKLFFNLTENTVCFYTVLKI